MRFLTALVVIFIATAGLATIASPIVGAVFCFVAIGVIFWTNGDILGGSRR